jgi:Zn finger protein HypA/HybF involved in hydrogenase expression
MHEMSVALEVCRVAEAQVGRNRLSEVLTVAVEVGDLAGVEIGNFEFCLETLLAHPPFGRAKPLIERSSGDALRVQYLEVEDGD